MIASDPSGGTVRSQSAEITPRAKPSPEKKKGKEKKVNGMKALHSSLTKKSQHFALAMLTK